MSMAVRQHVSLKRYNTLRVHETASYFVDVASMADLAVVFDEPYAGMPKRVLGGGSNLLITKSVEGLVIHNRMVGIEVVDETQDTVLVMAAGGTSWHDLVTWAVEHDLAGIENMALIPGTVGAAPVQHIGAYGQQLSDVFERLDMMNLTSGDVTTLEKSACHFGYRDSIFKHMDQSVMVTSVTVRLHKQSAINTSYFSMGRRNDSLADRIARHVGDGTPTIRDVYEAVIALRREKLLDPENMPTCGSYFKNPLVTREKAEQLSLAIPNLQLYPADQLTYTQHHDPAFDAATYVKIPAGRLIDERGWAGRTIGHVFMSPSWASLVTHDGAASGSEILAYLDVVRDDIDAAYDVLLEPEVVSW